MLSLLSGLRVYAAIGTWVAAGASIVLWLATGWGAAWSSAIGLLIGLVVLVIAGVTAQGATARSANRSRFHILRDWAQDLMATAKANPSTDCAAAASADPIQARLDVQRRLLETCKGPHWISGKGYVSVSRSLAEIEVSLLGRMTVSDLLDQARFDKMRLTGSSVENRDGLLALLNGAIDDLTAAMSQVGPTAKPPLVMAKSVNCPSAAEEVKPQNDS